MAGALGRVRIPGGGDPNDYLKLGATGHPEWATPSGEANIPTADGKTAADAIGAATGATTALKLANLASPASPTQQGVALLGASGGAAKLTKMPDGATGSEYTKLTFTDVDSWSTADGGSSVAAGGGKLALTVTGGAGAYRILRVTTISKGLGLSIVEFDTNTSVTKVEGYRSGIGWIDLTSKYIGPSTSRYFGIIPNDINYNYIQYRFTVSGNTTVNISAVYYGQPTYLVGSLSEEATRIADQLGDTAGVGSAATATITSNGTNVNTPASGTLTTTTSLPAADSTFKVGTKTYTWKSSLTPTEGEVLLEATVAACLTNARDAVNGTAGTLGTKHQCTANALFTATASATILTVTAILRGTVGNGATYEIVAGAGSELTASGALATGGVDDTVTIGGKVYTWKGVLTPTEGEVLVGTTSIGSLSNLSRAVTRELFSSWDGTYYKIAAQNPIVYALDTGANILALYAGTSGGSANRTLTQTPGILGNSITIAKSASAATLTLANALVTTGATTLWGGKDDVGEKIRTQVENYIAGSGTRPAAAKMELTNTALIGYETTVDVASDGTLVLPAGGTWYWNVYGYGATIGSAKRGSSAGGTTLTVAGANASVGYRRTA